MCLPIAYDKINTLPLPPAPGTVDVILPAPPMPTAATPLPDTYDTSLEAAATVAVMVRPL